ncbi:hypothetical protein ROJ8625_02608 [Roseivivax jejudonensis]|uniref:DUF2125 domain-containing protein n=1 Tax=Roseivivax jejudonensis TaxID=1529041 RepID=A0A1X6ZIF4_9RHOB|nr:DUF2125 domain-containing protein [Roseivivax jejudonensis]SLN52022.1 hypothetical protein ROJ8625_02608 [Roseivivax jejudonensis]
MKRLAILVAAAAVLWSGYWWVEARAFRSLTAGAFADLQADGWEARYSDLSVSGFPNRVDATVEDLVLADPPGDTAWEAPFVQVFRLVYDHSHFIFAFPERQHVTLDGTRSDVTSEGLRASLVLGPGQSLGRLHAEAVRLTAVSDDGRLDLSDLRANLDAVEPGSRDYRLSVAAKDGREADRDLSLRATLTFDAPPGLSDAAARIETIDIARAEYTLPDARVRLSGTLDVDDRGRLSGDVSILAEDWQALLDDAVDEGRVPESWAETAEDALGLVARIRGSEATLDVGLRLERGEVYLGPVRIGEAPRLPAE